MNKVKYALSAITVVAAIGGAFAFKKAGKLSTVAYYTKDVAQCNQRVTAFFYTIPTGTAVAPVTFATSPKLSCDRIGYLLPSEL